MRYKALPPFHDYFKFASETAQINLKEDPSGILTEMKKVHTFYADHIFSDGNGMDQIAVLLGIQAYYSLLAAAKVAISGHAAATYPLYRTAIEAACYSFMINHDPELSKIWIDRHKDDASKKLCRKGFTSAVRDAAKLIEKHAYISDGTEQWIADGYDLSIDFGAHPNPNSIFHHVTINEEYSPEEVSIDITALHGPNDGETKRALLALLDYALLVSVILVARRQNVPDDALMQLHELNANKDKLAASLIAS